ncbi:MAG: DUF4293 domain-containing protein [Bacteroidales bacterium]|nr:DUF4293 domain-containing protein [Bacteroidales bacterium]
MIQRIQTIYLLAHSVITTLLFVFPFSEMLTTNKEVLVFKHSGIINVTTEEVLFSTLPLSILIAIILVLGIVSIFLFKKRILQMRICIYNIVITVGLIGMFVFYHFSLRPHLDISTFSYKIGPALPVVMIFFLIQAFRSIRKDEILVKSYDRLR